MFALGISENRTLFMNVYYIKFDSEIQMLIGVAFMYRL